MPIWQESRIVAAAAETPRVRRLTLAVGWTRPFRAGQHVDVRLTAPDGYQAQRSYSIASSPTNPGTIDLLIERLDDGEVSGSSPTWPSPATRSSCAGRSAAPSCGSRPRAGRCCWSAAAPGGAAAGHAAPPGGGRARRAGPAALFRPHRRGRDRPRRANAPRRRGAGLPAAAGADPGARRPADRCRPDRRGARRSGTSAHTFVCGSNPFVSAVSDLLVDAGVPAATIRTERFGGETP